MANKSEKKNQKIKKKEKYACSEKMKWHKCETSRIKKCAKIATHEKNMTKNWVQQTQKSDRNGDGDRDGDRRTADKLKDGRQPQWQSQKKKKNKKKCNQQKVKQYKKNQKQKKKTLKKKPETKTIAARCKRGGREVGRVEGEGDYSLQQASSSRCVSVPQGGRAQRVQQSQREMQGKGEDLVWGRHSRKLT